MHDDFTLLAVNGHVLTCLQPVKRCSGQDHHRDRGTIKMPADDGPGHQQRVGFDIDDGGRCGFLFGEFQQNQGSGG